MSNRLIIISDLWGFANAQWISVYTNVLDANYKIELYDARALAEVDQSLTEQSLIHKKFVDGGIDTAVGNLLTAEQGSVSVLAFSIGGTIAWKAALNGLKIDHLYAVSATRLRLETQKPNGKVSLFYGDHDINRPDENWFKMLMLDPVIFKQAEHNLYENTPRALEISNFINHKAKK